MLCPFQCITLGVTWYGFVLLMVLFAVITLLSVAFQTSPLIALSFPSLQFISNPWGDTLR